jgi:serine/threonine-protein kinase
MKIGASDWTVVSEHFDRLSELPAEQRSAELEALSLDERHRRQLRYLLDQHDRADSLGLDTGVPERLGLDSGQAQPEVAASPDWQGQRLGPWQVDEVIGRGGMSVIYRGHRADGQFEKQVAIKVLNRANLFGDGKRLGEETRILARLEHPGVARLIDSGTSEAGHSYLIMELVRGQALDTYCRERELSVQTIVALIVSAAQALEYAHQRQVVHCDIKPANLLVRANGRLCVVDFGIATILQRQPDAERHLYCSPAYTAPERFRRAPPDTSQDVFSLGAVLEKLTAGRADRDLSAICKRATASCPQQRYPGMNALRTELTAWQDKRPVAARGGGRLYILGRWLQRHALVAALGLMLVASLTLGIAAALWQAREARSEAARAVAARDFLIGIFESADPALMRGEDPPASELLRRGADRVRSAMADQPRLLAELLHVIGRIQLERGLIGDAAASLDEVLAMGETQGMPRLRMAALSDRGMVAYEQGNFSEAVELLEHSRELAVDIGVDAAQLDRIEVRLADMLLIDGQAERALGVIEPVLDRLAAAGHGKAASMRADALRVKGAALHESGRLAQAQGVLEQALELEESFDEDDILLAKIENDLGVLHWDRRELDAAAGMFERSLRHKQRIYGDDHPQTLSSLGNLAGVNMSRGDHQGAEAAWQRSLESLARVHDAPHPDIAYTWGMLASSHYMRNDFTGALELVRKGLEHRAGLPDEDLPLVAWLTPLRGLLRVELDQPEALADLQRLASDCGTLDGLSALQQRMCLARRVLETDPPARCVPDQVPAAAEATRTGLPHRWRAAHRLLEARCLERATDLGAVNDPALPRWLRRRLPPEA